MTSRNGAGSFPDFVSNWQFKSSVLEPYLSLYRDMGRDSESLLASPNLLQVTHIRDIDRFAIELYAFNRA